MSAVRRLDRNRKRRDERASPDFRTESKTVVRNDRDGLAKSNLR
jgi:hypothetical protein